MALFGRNTAQVDAQAKAASEASHRLTLDLSRAETLAAMLAHSRASSVVDVTDLVAGMYLYGWDRLSRYWDSDDQERMEISLRKMCQISPQRWNYWIQFYDSTRRKSEKTAALPRILQKFQKSPASASPLKRSAELEAIFRQAEELAPLRDTSGARSIPILTSECILLCIVRNRGVEIGRKLAASGINVPQLEKDALSSRRAPRA